MGDRFASRQGCSGTLEFCLNKLTVRETVESALPGQEGIGSTRRVRIRMIEGFVVWRANKTKKIALHFPSLLLPSLFPLVERRCEPCQANDAKCVREHTVSCRQGGPTPPGACCRSGSYRASLCWALV